MAEIEKDIKELDRLTALERLLVALKEGEESAEEKGWIMADEVEVELEHDQEAALCSSVLS